MNCSYNSNSQRCISRDLSVALPLPHMNVDAGKQQQITKILQLFVGESFFSLCNLNGIIYMFDFSILFNAKNRVLYLI